MATAHYQKETFDHERAQAEHSTVTIDEPTDDDGTNCADTRQAGLPVEGTADLVQADQLWILVQAPGLGAFFVATEPLRTGVSGKWATHVVHVGGDADVGERLEIVAVTGDLDAANFFERMWSTSNDSDQGFDSLPDGAHVRAQVCVERVD
jgi:hypothetical protein